MNFDVADIHGDWSSQGYDFLGVIPARAGSKGIANKNIRDFAGRPLIHWTIKAALESTLLDRVIISTESPEILTVALDYAEIESIARPESLSGDDVPGVEPVLHAIACNPAFRNVVVLQPTSPLRTASEIDEAIRYFKDAQLVSLATVSLLRKPLEWMFERDSSGAFAPLRRWRGIALRQQCQPVAALNGSIYVAEREWLMRNRALTTNETFLYETPANTSLDLDDEIDWILGEALVWASTGPHS